MKVEMTLWSETDPGRVTQRHSAAMEQGSYDLHGTAKVGSTQKAIYVSGTMASAVLVVINTGEYNLELDTAMEQFSSNTFDIPPGEPIVITNPQHMASQTIQIRSLGAGDAECEYYLTGV